MEESGFPNSLGGQECPPSGTTIVESFRGLRKFIVLSVSQTRDFLAPRRQERKVTAKPVIPSECERSKKDFSLRSK
jgi:hypothetical protein